MPEKGPDTSMAEEKSETKLSSGGGGGGDDKNKRKRRDKTKPLTKVVIRRLPPTMSEETFLQQIEPIPDHDSFYFVSDMSLGSSRAYIHFCHQDDIFIFKEKFDGYVFVDNKGVEYPAVVEFAPFQGLAKIKSRKKDNKCGTIETDPHFMQFLESLKQQDDGETGKPEMKLEYSYQIKDDKKITSTPLLEYIASKKLARREERRKRIEDRKKQREDDKVRKQNQVSKAIPASIQEEDDDGIIVRTIKSRSFERGDRGKNKDRAFEQSSSTSAKLTGKLTNAVEDKQNSKAAREVRDRKRDERRRAERERREQDRQKNRDTEVQAKNRDAEVQAKNRDDRDRGSKKDRVTVDGKRDNDNKGGGANKGVRDQQQKAKEDALKSSGVVSGTTAAVKEEKVKKYSESRRERFARIETMKNNGKETKTDKIDDKKAPKLSEKDKVDVPMPTKSSEKDKVDEPMPPIKQLERENLNAEVADVKSAVDEKPETATDPKNEEEKTDTQLSSLNDDALQIEKNAAERKLSIDDGQRSSSSGDGGNADKGDSQTRRIRNKDRPSLLIYQPGKRRLGTASIGKRDEPTKSESPTEKQQLDSKLSPSTSSSTVAETVKEKADGNDGVAAAKPVDSDQAPKKLVCSGTSITTDEPKKTEKKVTRYSERRNRAKERRGSKSDRNNADVETKPTSEEERKCDQMPIGEIMAAAIVESVQQVTEIISTNDKLASDVDEVKPIGGNVDDEETSQDKQQTVEIESASAAAN